jgi:signal transduction histidine kinase
VEAHGGTIHAQNAEGGGAQFICEFPCAQAVGHWQVKA